MSAHCELANHARNNRAAWTRWAPDYVEPGRRNWADPEPTWGIWGVPEAELRILSDVAGRDAIELGCGTAQVSAWLARRGARPVGIDVPPAQLETAWSLPRWSVSPLSRAMMGSTPGPATRTRHSPTGGKRRWSGETTLLAVPPGT